MPYNKYYSEGKYRCNHPEKDFEDTSTNPIEMKREIFTEYTHRNETANYQIDVWNDESSNNNYKNNGNINAKPNFQANSRTNQNTKNEKSSGCSVFIIIFIIYILPIIGKIISAIWEALFD